MRLYIKSDASALQVCRPQAEKFSVPNLDVDPPVLVGNHCSVTIDGINDNACGIGSVSDNGRIVCHNLQLLRGLRASQLLARDDFTVPESQCFHGSRLVGVPQLEFEKWMRQVSEFGSPLPTNRCAIHFYLHFFSIACHQQIGRSLLPIVENVNHWPV